MSSGNVNTFQQAKTWAVLAHVGGLLSSFLAPLVIYLIKKGEPDSEFAVEHAREALNFQITLLLAYFVLAITVVGWFIIWIPLVLDLVCAIVGAVKAGNGQAWRYPMTLRLVK